MLKKEVKILIILLMFFGLIFTFNKIYANTSSLDLNKKASLEIMFSLEEEPIDEVEFKIYKIANLSANFEITLTDKFKKYNLELENLENNNIQDLASTLSIYALTDNITPDRIGSTNRNGSIIFENLELGVYLVIGEEYINNNYKYVPVPYLVSLPINNKDTNLLQYNILAKVKYETKPIEDIESFVTKKVIIVWNDKNYEAKRPLGITVNLYRNEELYDTIILNEDNNWRCIWENLSNKYEWTIKEGETLGTHTSIIKKQDDTYIITKSYDEKNEEVEEEIDKEKPIEQLPQTGMLWWPVPVMLILGIIILIIVFLKSKEKEISKNKRIIYAIIGISIITIAIILSLYNVMDEKRAYKYANNIIEKIEFSDKYTADYIKNPDISMPVQEINGNKYIGVIEIPAIDVYLPVINECTNTNLKKAPCCYYGSAYKDNMVIAAHNYKDFFGNLKELQYGDEIIFKDIDGNVFKYKVFEIEILNGKDVENMKNSNSDLTLFTCTYSGQSRITVRCKKQV